MSEKQEVTGVAASPPGHQPSASAADASSQSGVPNAGDWIAWDGGLCPVPSHALVEIRFRYRRFGEKVRLAGKVDWGRFDQPMLTDIIAYRLASAMSAGTAETAPQAQGQRPASAAGKAGDAQ